MSSKLRLHRYSSWLLSGLSLVVFLTGYALTHDWPFDVRLLYIFHRLGEIGFLSLLALHVYLTLRYYPMRWNQTFRMLRQRKATTHFSLRFVQGLTAWLIVILTFIIVLSGIGRFSWFTRPFEEVVPFEPHVVYDVIFGVLIIIHTAVGAKFLLRRYGKSGSLVDILLVILTICFIVVLVSLNLTIPDIAIDGGGGSIPSRP